MAQLDDPMDAFSIPWELRRGKWTADEAHRAATSLVAWCRDQRPPSQPETEDAVLAAELVRRLAAMSSDAADDLATLLDGIELPSFPEIHTHVLAALGEPVEARLDALLALDGDPVERLAALLQSMTPRERTSRYDRAPEYEAAITLLAAIATPRALEVLLSAYPDYSADETFSEAIINAVATFEPRLLTLAIELWPRLSHRARRLAIDSIPRSPADERVWSLLAGWLDEARGDAVRDVVDCVTYHVSPERDLGFEAGLRKAESGMVRAEVLLHGRLERARAAGDHVAAASLKDGLDELAGFRKPPRSEDEMRAEHLEQSIRQARESDVSYRTYLAENGNVGIEVQKILAVDPSEKVRCSLANHTKERAIQDMLVTDPSAEVRVALAKRDGIDVAVLEQLASDAEPTVRCAVARGASEEVRRRLYESDPNDDVRAWAASSLPLQGQQLEDVARDRSPAVRACVADRPGVTVGLLRQLASDPDPRVRRSVAHSSRAPRSLLRQLANDEDDYVVRLAKSALDHDRGRRLCECCGKLHEA